MKRNSDGLAYLSTFDLKRQITALLAGELVHCGFAIVLGFESSFKNRICTLKFADGKRLETCVNLGYVKKSICSDGISLMLKVHYCALYVAAYIKQIERAKNSVPQSYFEGLAFLNAIEVCRSEQTVSVYSPLFHWDQGPKGSCCLRPLEISSAINALNQIRLFPPMEINEREASVIDTLCDSLLLYAGLPEVSYVHASAPVYALADSLRKLADIIDRAPEIVRRFPVLALAPFERIEQMTVDDLLLFCLRSENAFLMGVSIRLIAFFHPSFPVDLPDSAREKLVGEMKQYIDDCLAYYFELPKTGRCLRTDNLYAIRTAVQSVNRCLDAFGASVAGGNIHPMI